ncbi:MAG: uroporphyrinogen decarboxylase family protein [Nitrososphaerota archaeon]|nr:uroporphyrinogen decarboxylase family protein [Nitrososphaerota archaeon]
MVEALNKAAEELARERMERMDAVANLKEPDRVPLQLGFDYGFIAKWSGITVHELLFDYEKAYNAILKVARDFPTDSPPLPMMGCRCLLGFALRDYPDVSSLVGVLTGRMHDILQDTYTGWPGRELPANSGSYQFIGGEFLKQDEYDEFIEDPVRFAAEKVVPRAHKALRKPGSAKAMAALVEAALEGRRYSLFLERLAGEIAKFGYAFNPSTLTLVPLDFIGDYLRTIPGVLIDLWKTPDKVKMACDAMMKVQYSQLSERFGSLRRVGIPLHLNEYLSPRLYGEFYWPYLKKIIVDFNSIGIKCGVAFEGRHDAHLERILELPKAWGTAMFEKTDVRKAKKILAGHTCISGGIPPTLLMQATPEKVEEYVRDLLKEVMPGGGFILASSTAIPAETPVENIRAVMKAVEKYGVYRR